MHQLPFTLGLLFCFTVVCGQTPHGKNFKGDCSKCHTTTGWKVDWKTLSFNHDTTDFKLTGQHRMVNCRSCHKSLEFSDTKTECKDCHDDLHENTLGKDCSRCHTPKSWIVENISELHRQGRLPLTGAHQITDCFACHKTGSMRRFDPLGIECADCHKSKYLATTKPNHLTAGYSTNCIQCHSASSSGWVGRNIEHSFFPLTQGHSINCNLCHVTGEYKKIPADCISCHQKDYNSTTIINHQLLNFSTTCTDCHTTSPKWAPARYTAHDGRFFPVYSGRHSGTWNNCSDCHNQTGNFALFSCVDCHAHAKSSMDNSHQNVNGYRYVSVDCFTCHPTGSREGSFNHSKTSFPLTGAHVSTDCAGCHTSTFAGTSTDCNSCHKAKYDQAQAPIHATAGISTQCETCHSTTAWKPSTFSHVTTGYDLVGGHSKVAQCADCHKGTVLNTKTDCISCHQVQFDNAKDHKAQSFPVDCKVCHSMDNWLNATFNHALTPFPLTGAHLTTVCAACHSKGYAGTPTDCNSCHAATFATALNPNHVAAGIPVLCETCHNTNAWKPSKFNHTTTGFALAGGHANIVQCSDCHKGTVLNSKTDCISCHQVQFDNAKDHKTQSFPVDCTICHNMNNWLNATFNHALTPFPLTGAHLSVPCASCHTKGYAGTPTDCNSCHATNFTTAQNPNHVAAGIPVLCETCHNTNAWKPSSFNHTTTGFALTGGHAAILQCSDCHKGTVLNSKTDCMACHQVQYDGAPNHKGQSYPTDCTLCHNMNNWLNANFNHNSTGFPLTGAHATTLCAKCHVNGFKNTPTTCISCHQANYDQATNPNHTTAQFPKDCESCHTTNAWSPSTFNHDTRYFPIYSGRHNGTWTLCSECHTTSTNYSLFSCVVCHAHSNKASVDSHHREVANYSYNSVACYTCHPRGGGGGF